MYKIHFCYEIICTIVNQKPSSFMSDLYCELSERDSQYEEVAEEVAFADGTRPKIWTRFRKLKLNWIFVCEWMWEWLFFSSLTGGFFCMRPVSFFSSKKSRFFFLCTYESMRPLRIFFPTYDCGFFLNKWFKCQIVLLFFNVQGIVKILTSKEKMR
jgi:hypothetical protein